MNQLNSRSPVETPNVNREQTPMIPRSICAKLVSRMRRTKATLGLALGLILIAATNCNAQDDKTQNWQGVLDAGSVQLTLKVEITEMPNGEGHSAVVRSVEQGNSKIPVDHVEVTESEIILDMGSINAKFEGTLDESGQVCNGTFSQHGADFDLELKLVDATEEDAGELVEYWKGTFEFEGTDLEMGLKIFRMSDGSLTAKFSSYSQGATDLPVEFEKDGDTYKMNLPAARLKYIGTLDQSKEKLSGLIKQGGREDKLDFVKTDFDDAPKFNRPQNPEAPFPYESKEVSYENSKQGNTLSGTLTLPPGDGPFPVAITISGSGAADRDESHFGHKPFLVIADHLTRKGIAVLRYDDRGIGGSTGDYASSTSADLATDVEAGIEFLKNHPQIDGSKIGLIGHSEGGLIAPMVASERDDVHFVVLLAGTGVNGGVILKSQSTAMMEAAGESEEKLDANRKVHDAILSLIEKNPKATDIQIKAAADSFLDSIEDEETRQLMEPSANQLVAIMKSKWVRYFVQHDPAKALAEVDCHVLAMNGEKDLQVLCDLNLNPIEKALQKGSPASFEIVRLPNTNHMFQETDGSGSPEEYGTIEETFSPKALTVVSDWITKVTK